MQHIFDTLSSTIVSILVSITALLGFSGDPLPSFEPKHVIMPDEIIKEITALYIPPPTEDIDTEDETPDETQKEEVDDSPPVETPDIETPPEDEIVDKNTEEDLEKASKNIPIAPQTAFGRVQEATSKALVNIICLSSSDNTPIITTGSGIIISEKGVVLTNAHIAQYALIEDPKSSDNDAECFVRTGNPATTQYNTELLFIPPTWVKENAHTIVEDNPRGTGEDDYAFLRITGVRESSEPLPEVFPYIPPENELTQDVGDLVLSAGYPAELLSGAHFQDNLYSLISINPISHFYTFTGHTLDLFSVKGSIVAQKGSSGGAIVTRDTSLIGLIVTSTGTQHSLKEMNLQAITLSHINRSLMDLTGSGINEFISGDIEKISEEFNRETAPQLKQLFIDELNKQDD